MPTAVKVKPREHAIKEHDSRVLYPWDEMGIGDWFFASAEGKTLEPGTTPAKLHNNIIFNIRQCIKKKYPAREFMAIATDTGVKVWRYK